MIDNKMKAGQNTTQDICERKCPRAAVFREKKREKQKKRQLAAYHDEENRTKEYRQLA
jgi:hypothetical protein